MTSTDAKWQPAGFRRKEDVGRNGSYWVSTAKTAYYTEPVYPASALTAQEAEIKRLREALEHEQWEIIAGAISRYKQDERDADYTIGIVEYGFIRLIEAKLAALYTRARATLADTAGERR